MWVKATNADGNDPILLNLATVRVMTRIRGGTMVRFGEAGSIEVKEEPEVLLRNARETGGEDW